VVPARTGSKGVPNKNFKPFAGGACLTMRALVDGMEISPSHVVLSTDSEDFREPALVQKVMRPPELARDDTPMWEVLKHLSKQLGWTYRDKIVLLQPNCLNPHRATLVRRALKAYPPVVSVWRYPDRWHPAYEVNSWRTPSTRQGLPAAFRPNGLFYIWSALDFMPGSDRRDSIVIECDCYNIDTQADWDEAEAAYGHL
jgi:CMP-N-acetylneuraminic acid synthetase